jgi:hypothetical protein
MCFVSSRAQLRASCRWLMRPFFRTRPQFFGGCSGSRLGLLLFAWFALAGLAAGQQEAGNQEGGSQGELVIRTASLPKAWVRQPYHFRLQAEGGIAPLQWEVTSGALPTGCTLDRDGEIKGVPGVAGEFRFVATVRDSSRLAQQRDQEFVLRVLAPLEVRWSRYPQVNGPRVEGAVAISNSTEQDFDLTVIVLAVNEIGRATALGYQRFSLKSNITDFEVPFAENLPPGSYEVHVDAVAEVAPENVIHRARLVTGDRLQVQQIP